MDELTEKINMHYLQEEIEKMEKTAKGLEQMINEKDPGIIAEGEFQASKNMTEAAKQHKKTPAALRLRELQILVEITQEKNLIIISSENSEESVSKKTGG
jgi:hypothetical protein